MKGSVLRTMAEVIDLCIHYGAEDACSWVFWKHAVMIGVETRWVSLTMRIGVI